MQNEKNNTNNTDKIVVGLDIGTTKICVMAGRLNEYGRLEIIGCGEAKSEGVSGGQVMNIDLTTEAIRKAVAIAEKQANININVVNVGIANQHIKSWVQNGSITRSSNDTEITINDVNRLTGDMHRLMVPSGSQIIHVMPQDYTVDYESGIKDPVGWAGVRLEANFHIITAQISAIRNIRRCLQKAGLEIDELFLEPIASSLSVLTAEEKEAGVVLIDIGGGTTDIAIFHDNIIRHTAVIPWGGNSITSDIEVGCMILNAEAEKLKTKYGVAMTDEIKEELIISIPGLRNRPPKEISMRNLSGIIEARMEEIIDRVHLEVLKEGYENKLAGGIVITGGGAMLQAVHYLFQYLTGMDSRIGHPNEHLGRHFCENTDIKNPKYATCIGLVLAGFRSVDDRENRYVEKGYNNSDNTANATGNLLRRTSNASEAKKSDFIARSFKQLKDLLIDENPDKSKDY